MKFLLCILLLSCLEAVRCATLNRVLFTDAEVTKWNSRCLDGSRAGFYYLPNADPSGANKWVVWLQGGGYCLPGVADHDCAERAGGPLGSSMPWALTTNRFTPPRYASSYNQIYVPYCSGDFHSGTQTQPSNDGLYYSGHLIVAAVFQKLKANYRLNAATEVLFGGDSAGGIGTFINLDYVLRNVSSTTKVYAFPNAGWFINYPSWADALTYNQIVQGIIGVANSYVNKQCAANFAPYLCFSANYSYTYLKNTPIFIAESYYDTQVLSEKNGIDPIPSLNATANQYVLNYGNALRSTLTQTYSVAATGFFYTSDLVHVIPDASVSINGKFLQFYVTNWYNRNNIYKARDQCKTPECKSMDTPTTVVAGTSTAGAFTKRTSLAEEGGRGVIVN